MISPVWDTSGAAIIQDTVGSERQSVMEVYIRGARAVFIPLGVAGVKVPYQNYGWGGRDLRDPCQFISFGSLWDVAVDELKRVTRNF